MFAIGAGAGLQQALLVVAAPVLSRLYTPDEFGVAGVILSLPLILVPVSGLRYELALPIAETREVRPLVAAAVGSNVMTAIAFAFIIAATAPQTAAALGIGTDYLWAMPLTLLGAGVYETMSYAAIRGRRYRSLAGTRAVQGLANVTVALGLGALRGPIGLILGNIVGRSAGASRLFRLTIQRSNSSGEPSGLREVLARYRRFPIYSTWVGISSSLSLYVLPLFLVRMYGVVAGGLYVFAARIVQQPMTVLGGAVAQVFLGEAARVVSGPPDRLRRLYLRTLGVLAAVAVAPFAVLALFGEPLFAFVFGEEWRAGGTVLRVAIPMFAAQFITSPLSQTLAVLERQDVQFMFAMIRLALVGAALVAAVQLQLSFLGAVASFTWAMVVSYALLAGLSIRILNQRAGQPATQAGDERSDMQAPTETSR